jgi:hypothetical protein
MKTPREELDDLLTDLLEEAVNFGEKRAEACEMNPFGAIKHLEKATEDYSKIKDKYIEALNKLLPNYSNSYIECIDISDPHNPKMLDHDDLRWKIINGRK